MLPSLLLGAALALAAPAPEARSVAVQAGTVHLVEDGRVLTGGATILIQDGKIVAAGTDVTLPPGTRVVDYGPDAVVVPGFVAADSRLGSFRASERTADLTLRAIDFFDPFTTHARSLAEGVTTAYIAPAERRLIGGQGAVVKLGGESERERIVSESAAIDGSIAEDARSTPGYWEPPIPATVDVGMGVEQPQLPRTAMGAIVALRELLALAAEGGGSEEYGSTIASDLAELIEAKRVWRMRAEEPHEIRALVDFFQENALPLVLEATHGAGSVAELIAERGVSVILHHEVRPDSPPRDHGKDEGDDWPTLDAAAKLAEAGVPLAIAPTGGVTHDLRFAADLAVLGGLANDRALEAITLAPARMLGVDGRVGSIAPGKDADLAVLNGSPLGGSSVMATWIGGEIVWKAHEDGAVVLEVDELHLGDGEVLAPGQVLMLDGEIREVGRRVAHPIGCTVVRGKAAMPGMIDARGHLGLEGSGRVPGADFSLTRIVEPGDYADRRVAQAGVTTVLMTPRGIGRTGTHAMAYKPAGEDLERMIVDEVAAVHVAWTEADRLASGAQVRELLAKSAEYAQEWRDYEEALANWTPPPPQAAADEDADEEEEESEEDEDDDEKKSKKRKKRDKDAPPPPITGVWEAEVTVDSESEGAGDTHRMRFRLLDEDGALKGNLRCDPLSDELIELTGTRDEHAVTLHGLSTEGRLTVEATRDEDTLSGTATVGELALEFEAKQTSKEWIVVSRPGPKVGEEEEEKDEEPEGKPEKPDVEPELEPFKRAMEGEAAVVVAVERADEIRDCVDTFESYGIRPILLGADDAWKLADELRGRIAGVLLDHRVISREAKQGTEVRNRYAELANRGIPIAFHSSAEEGAAELPLMAAYAVSKGMSPEGAIRALTSDAARMLRIDDRVGRLEEGLDADVLLLAGDPTRYGVRVMRVWVSGREIRARQRP